MPIRMPKFVDADHALQTGYFAGTLAKAGIECSVRRDELGNYLPLIEVVILEPGEVEPIRMTVQVMSQEGAQDERTHDRG